MTREEAEEALGDESIAMFLDGYDDCIAGISYRFNMEPLVIYNESAIINKLIDGGAGRRRWTNILILTY